MSTIQQLYLGMVIVALLAFIVTLAWGQIYVRGADKRRPASAKSQPSAEAQPDRKLAA